MRDRIPPELRLLPQWVSAGPNKIPLNPRTGAAADVNDPTTWGTFEDACRTGYQHIGFVLSPVDPYTIIDLDDPEKLREKGGQAAVDRATDLNGRIYNAFETYAEVSQSGKGVHIIARGLITPGRRRDTVEVYSSGRYMICTGAVLRNLPIVDQQALLNQLIADMPLRESVALDVYESPYTDSEIIERAVNAVNGEKYLRLVNGQITDYPSQSEADYALLSMLCYYTRDNDQVRRLFWASALGKREKAHRGDYLNRALAKIRSEQPSNADMEQAARNAQAMVTSAAAVSAQGATADCRNNCPNLTTAADVITEAPTGSSRPNVGPSFHRMFPPGLVGAVADYIYKSAVRPVPELGLAAAIAFVAGICGRAYNISGTGLAQYVIFVARTGTGKEGAASGINRLIASVRPTVPAIMHYTGPAVFGSGQGIVRVLDEKPCFFSVLGEFGLTLQQVCDPRANGAQQNIKKVLLDVYGKSGINELLYPSVYSEKTKNTNVVQAPNISIFGESTPDSFFDGLTPRHVAEGLVPRFLVVEYTGDRPRKNANAGIAPTQELVHQIGDLVAAASNAAAQGMCTPVATTPDALALLDQFDAFCDDQITGNDSETERQIWNRAHLKALKLAALIAVGNNPNNPIITYDIAQWAVEFVHSEVKSVYERFVQGNVGEGESKQEFDLRKIIEDYITLPYTALRSYGVDPVLHRDKIIPYDYLRRRGLRLAAIYKDRRGPSMALRSMLADLTAADVLLQLDKVLASQKYGKRSSLYMIGSAW